MSPHTMALLDDLTQFVLTFWPAFVLTFFIFVAFLYIFAYQNRFFEYLKAQESRYLDRRTLELIKRILIGTWTFLGAVVVLVPFSAGSPVIRDYAVQVILHMPSILFVTFVLMATIVAAGAVRRNLTYLRGQLEDKPEKVISARSFAVTEVIVRYALYLFGVVVAAIGGLALLPPQNSTVADFVSRYILAPLEPYLRVSFLTVLIATFVIMAVAVRVADSFFSDFKVRTTKYNPRVLELFRTTTMYAIYAGAALAIIFLILSVNFSADQLLLIGLILVISGIAGVLVLYEAISDALAGVALINADPYQEGDRIKIGENMVADVLEVNLTLTKVKNLRGEVVNLPNKELLAKTITNFSRSKTYAMTVDITVSFDRPHRKVEALLTKAAQRVEGILTDPAPVVYAREIHGNA
ncbi:MAG: mechanosensitive ion channel family protein, partial [Candidatus Thermoplasmatota archaeon]|nr:mechanosensitive ion channel family protein [Candidatus Thermoplasmatota archaeon]